MLDQVLEGRYASPCLLLKRPRHARVVNWNIERGQKLPDVMAFIRSQQADICILQEVDLNARRTGTRNVAEVLAAEFKFNYVFGIEFEELSQESEPGRAFSGQAVLARCEMSAPRILRFSRQSDIWRPRWYLPRWSAFQPRRGGRMALVVELAFGRARVVVYDLHLESQCDDALRLWQLSEVLQDSVRYPPDTPVIIAGDLNTRKSPSPLERYLEAAGFRDGCQSERCRATKPSGQRLDWIFTRGPAVCTGTTAHRDIRASDHYPLSTNLTLNG